MTNTFAIGSADIAAEEFDSEYVVLDLGSFHYFSLSSGTALVWKCLVDGHSIEAACAELPETSPVRLQIASLVTSFLEHGLLKAAPREPTTPVGPFSSPIAAEGLTFELEVFDDLSDLLMADPVHDVDEGVGWPHRPLE